MILSRLIAALVRRSPPPQAPQLRELLARRADPDAALAALRAAHASAPLEGDLLEAYVRMLIDAGHRGEALRVARGAASARPRSRESWFSLGLALQADHAYAEALESYDRAAAAGARDADLYASRGIALQNLGRLELAAADYARALEASPRHPLALFHASLLALMRGDYGQGWPQYETRLASADLVPRSRRYPRWNGEDPRGATILVYGEQGLGDEIMFASCLPDLERAGAHCIVECEPRLHALFARSFPHATVYAAAADKRVPDDIDKRGVDYEVPVGSLPLYCRRRLADFPVHEGYLRPDPQRVAAWRARLDALGPGPKVGVSWQGGTHVSRAPLRSIALERWLPILEIPGAHFVSLQYTQDAGRAVAALNDGRRIALAHWPDAISDYDETAALVSALDLTISVCTSIVHLAGALGRPVWVMAPLNPEWRYGHAGETMPWYPSARLFRQREGGAWGEVVDAVAGELRDLGDKAPEVSRNALAQALNAAGIARLGARDFRGAQSCFERAVEAAPRLAEAHCNLGIALVQQGRDAAAERHLREAIALDPVLLAARENLAVLLAGRSDYEGAMRAWDEVLALDPGHAEAHAARAFAAMREGLIDDACIWLERAVALGADRAAELEMHRAFAALSKADFEAGWALYDARLRGKLESAQRPYAFPEWDGEALADGALLVLGEQGLGDEIMFASCYAEAIARAGRCVIECEPRLEMLFARSFPAARIVGQARDRAHAELAASRDIVAQAHAGSLPRLLRPRRDAFPRHNGYLAANEERVQAWRARLGAGRARLVGIAWSGGLPRTGRDRRSIRPADFAHLLSVPGIEFVSLQHDDDGAVAAELAARSGARVHAFPDTLADIDDTAALIRSLDGVVTVCSSVVHLAGALGAPALVLTPRRAEWRYLQEGSALPWYPSVRLLRQREPGDWAGVIEEARALLTKTT